MTRRIEDKYKNFFSGPSILQYANHYKQKSIGYIYNIDITILIFHNLNFIYCHFSYNLKWIKKYRLKKIHPKSKSE